MKNWNHISLIALSALISVIMGLTGYAGYTIYAAESSEEPPESERCDKTSNTYAVAFYDEAVLQEYVDMGFTIAKYCYHRQMNNFFNERIETLVTLSDKEALDPDEKAIMEIPAGLTLASENIEDGDNINMHKENKVACSETAIETGEVRMENVSSYCISIEALDYYLGYVKTLNTLKGKTPIFGSDIPEDTRDYGVFFKLTGKRNAKIDEEYLEAKQVMENTVTAYNEFKLAYPMHKEYEKIIKSLIKYKLKLKDARRQVIRFPAEFIDATSIQCQ